MTSTPSFDVEAAHRYFSTHCFNAAWDLLDKKERTPDENEQMIRLCLAATWHWTQRPDCSATNLSVGYWQAARIYAVLGQPDNARRYGQLCLSASQGEGVMPFYLAYAYEALARAESVAGNGQLMQVYLAEARRLLDRVGEAEERMQLEGDLNTIH